MSITVQPPNKNYGTYTSSAFSITTGTYTLTLQGLNPNGGDNTMLVDAVKLNSVLVPNGGFETPVLATGTYSMNPAGATWSFTGTTGIAKNNSAFTNKNPNAPEGTQVGIVQMSGSISQPLNLLYRAYNSTIGRWLSRDPIEESGGINLYLYVHSHTLRENDPLGLQGISVPSGPIILPPVVPNPPGSNPNTPGGGLASLGGAMGRVLEDIDRWLATNNGLAGCKATPPSPSGRCKCCVVVLTGRVSDGGYMNWSGGSGHVVDQPCSQVRQRDAQNGVWKRPPPTITEVEYYDW